MSTLIDMQRIKPVVDAVLYEGYILYPYRPSSIKNRQRWTFGGIYPETYATTSGGAEPSRMQTECLLEGDADTRLEVRVRFLHLLAREVGALDAPLSAWPAEPPPIRRVTSLEVDGRQLQTWQEAVEREVMVAQCSLGELLTAPRTLAFSFDGEDDMQPIVDAAGWVRGALRLVQVRVDGAVGLTLQAVAEGAYRLSVRIDNRTPMDPATVADRDQANLYAFASTHTLLGIGEGNFVSLMDPPPALVAAAAGCQNQGSYPVLIGSAGVRNTMLSSPIILYDYPEVAPESPGDLYDALEIDEILSLRILAMTDAEKREMAATDPRGAALLARTEALDGDDFMRLHGVMRDPVPAATSADDCGLHVGDHVRLRPKPGGDIMDVVLAGMTAVIETIEHDLEDRVHVAVAIDDDPGREWGLQRMPGHRFFFSPEEVELLSSRQEISA